MNGKIAPAGDFTKPFEWRDMAGGRKARLF